MNTTTSGKAGICSCWSSCVEQLADTDIWDTDNVQETHKLSRLL